MDEHGQGDWWRRKLGHLVSRLVIEEGDDQAVAAHSQIYIALLNERSDLFSFAFRLAMAAVDAGVAQIGKSLSRLHTILLPLPLALGLLRSDQVLKAVLWEQAARN